MAKFEFTEKQLQELLQDIFDGLVDQYNIPEDLYFSFADRLKKGLYKGFGGTLEDFTGKDLELLEELRENVYMFSAARSYSQLRDMTDALVDNKGNVRPFGAFQYEAKRIFATYNNNYLSAEYDTAIASGQMAIRWNRIEKYKEILPFLRLSVVEDDNTSDICEPLDGITLPVDDPFWNEYYPPNHFRCRSTVEQLDEAVTSSTAEVEKATEHADEEMSDVFKMNVGKDKVVFSDEHPYFQVDKKDREYAADNFNLPIPEED